MSAAEAPIEIEAKFTLDDPARAEALAAMPALDHGLPSRDPIALGAVVEKRDRDAYADTADLRLLRAGWALRHRRREVAGADGRPAVKHFVTLKALSGAPAGSSADAADPAGAVQARAEFEGPLEGTDAPFDPSRWPPAVRQAAVHACGGAVPPLSPLFTLAQRRRVRPASSHGAAIGELSIDAVSVHLAGGGDDAVAGFDEVEFELAAGADSALLALIVPALAAASGGRASRSSKFDRAVSLLAAAPAMAALPAPDRARLAAALSQLGARRPDA